VVQLEKKEELRKEEEKKKKLMASMNAKNRGKIKTKTTEIEAGSQTKKSRDQERVRDKGRTRHNNRERVSRNDLSPRGKELK